ncbi:MAG: YwqG family protein [Chloroflexota bacterium]|nr:YwqG family protein [Chloroflexota bacterium]
MAFLVQVDLAATAPFDAEGVLPARGLLSFFYETDGEPLYAELWGKPAPQRAEDYPTRTDPRAWRVCYFPDGSPPLRRRSLPAAGDPSVRYPACAVRFSTQQTIPDPDTPEVVALGMTEAERRAYIALYYDEHSPNRGAWADPGNRLLGHPFTLGSTSSLVECGRASRVVRGDPLGPTSDEPRASIGRAAATRWRLLLQLDSGAAAAMDWAGGGVLHFCIERTALVRREFAGVQLNMQFL